MMFSFFPRAVVVFTVMTLAACAARQPAPPAVTEAEEDMLVPAPFQATRQVVLRCPELAPVAVLINDNAVRIETAAAPNDMLRVISASGVLYEAGGSNLWFKGDNAQYRQAGEDVGRECAVIPVTDPWQGAALRNVTFRAIGQEPGWLLEVVPDKWIFLLTDYGAKRYVVPPVAAVQEADGLHFSAKTEKHRLDVTVSPVSCHDGMSDEAFAATVSVVIDGRVLKGCGRWLGK